MCVCTNKYKYKLQFVTILFVVHPVCCAISFHHHNHLLLALCRSFVVPISLSDSLCRAVHRIYIRVRIIRVTAFTIRSTPSGSLYLYFDWDNCRGRLVGCIFILHLYTTCSTPTFIRLCITGSDIDKSM